MRTNDIDHELRFHIQDDTVGVEVVCLARHDDPNRSCTYARAGVYPNTTDGPCFVEEACRGLALEEMLQENVMSIRGFASMPVTWGVRSEHGTDFALLVPVPIPSRLDQVLTLVAEMAALLDPRDPDIGQHIVDLVRRAEQFYGEGPQPAHSRATTGHGERFLAAFVAEFRSGHHPAASPSDTITDAQAAFERARKVLHA